MKTNDALGRDEVKADVPSGAQCSASRALDGFAFTRVCFRRVTNQKESLDVVRRAATRRREKTK